MNIDHVFSVNGPKKGFCFIRTDWKGKVLAAYSGGGAYDHQLQSLILDPRLDKQFIEINNGESHCAALTKTATHQLNILQVAWPLCYNRHVSNRSFEVLTKHFGFTECRKNDAADECQALAQVYWALMKRYTMSLTGEEVVREIGNSAFQKVRGLLGV